MVELSQKLRVPRRIALELSAAAVLTGFVALSLPAMLHLPVLFAPLATLFGFLFAVIVGVFWQRAATHQKPSVSDSLGPANLVTLTRGILICVVAAFIPFSDYVMHHAWLLAWICLIALVMDGVDGATARRTCSQSAFGARFDMELDAFLILALCALLVTLDKVGFWVLLIGLIRYAFVTAGWCFPRLTRPLPDRFGRKAICVWQLATLMICLLPPVSPLAATVLLGIALTLLVYSFGKDILWLLGRSSSMQGETP